MIARIILLMTNLIISVFIVSINTLPIYAAEIIDCSNIPNSTDSIACKKNTKDPIAGNNGIIMKVTNIIAWIAGIAAVIVIMLGGLKIINSGGKPENVAKGRDMVLFAVIGIIVVMISRTIVMFVISRI